MSYFAANLPRQKHCFFGAEGGVSEGIYSSLNVNFSSDDKLENLQRNLDIAAGYYGLPRERLHIINQDVSNVVKYVSEPSFKQIECDGAVTDRPGVVLCIRTADCAPVLLADYEHGIIGAAHAGWRGAYKGVIENCVELMEQKGAVREKIAAAVGPCIGQPSYEVDKGFYQKFEEKYRDFEAYFKPGKPGHYYFDLEGFCRSRLEAAGVRNVTVSGLDTCALEGKYFSFRRNTLRGLIKGGPKNFPTEISTIIL